MGQIKKSKKIPSSYLKWILLSGVVVIAGIVIVITVTGKKEKVGDEIENVPSITQGIPTPEVTNPISTPTPEVSITPVLTQEPQVTEPPKLILSVEDALKKVNAAIGDDRYKPKLLDDHLNVEGKEFYSFIIYEEDKELTPMILVEKESGSLFLYDTEGNLSDFAKFPLDKVEAIPSISAEITKDQAQERLSKIPQDDLGISKPFTEYTIVIDDWTTVVQGEACYCFNLFEEKEDTKHLAAMFYVALDGNSVYRLNQEDNVFVKVSK